MAKSGVEPSLLFRCKVMYPGVGGSTNKVHHSEWHFESFCMPGDGINSNTSDEYNHNGRDRLQLIKFAIYQLLLTAILEN